MNSLFFSSYSPGYRPALVVYHLVPANLTAYGIVAGQSSTLYTQANTDMQVVQGATGTPFIYWLGDDNVLMVYKADKVDPNNLKAEVKALSSSSRLNSATDIEKRLNSCQLFGPLNPLRDVHGCLLMLDSQKHQYTQKIAHQLDAPIAEIRVTIDQDTGFFTKAELGLAGNTMKAPMENGFASFQGLPLVSLYGRNLVLSNDKGQSRVFTIGCVGAEGRNPRTLNVKFSFSKGFEATVVSQ